MNVIALAQQLVRLPSVSPMGRELPPDSPVLGERRVSERLVRWGAEAGVETQVQPVHPERDNVVFLLPGERAGVLLWEVHQDTVPVEGMTIDPFGGEIKDGKLYGRGACDVKGSMACMLSALQQLAADDPARRPTLVLACTADEEQGGGGAKVLPQLWERDSRLPRPDGCVVAEPTELDVVVAHKGAVRWRCRTEGRAAHSSGPNLGDNAIYRMGRVVQELDRYHREVLSQAETHPLLGGPTLSVGKISGGVSVNVVADRCEIEIDRRLLPADDPVDAMQQVQRHLADCGLDEQVIHEPPYLQSIALSDEHNQQLAACMSEAARTAGGAGRLIGVPFGTDAARLSPHLPCVVFGAGSIAQAHTKDEWVGLDQLERAAEALRQMALRWGP